jgi:two-component system sensor histidine kinase RegB
MAAARLGSAEITLRGLVTSRWVLIALLGGGVALMLGARHLVAPVINVAPNRAMITKFCVVLVVWAALNLLTSRVLLRRRPATLTLAGIHLLVDTAALTILIGITGGPANPFTLLYFVPVTLATQVSPRWTWALAAVCVAGFASLFVFADLPPSPGGHQDHFVGHMRGMWIAFGVSGVLITYFVQRIAVSLARQRVELARLREQALEDRHLASLGSLAAGAAHELGTPLGTIQVLAGELRYMDEADRNEAIASIRHELARCKSIVQQMVTPDARVSTLDAQAAPWALSELAVEAAAVGGVKAAVEIDPAAEVEHCRQPREAVGQIVRELLTNAAEACRRRTGSTGIRLRIGVDDGRAVIAVRDDGEGMTEDVATAAFDPFFSTKPEGSGMGLGLYLTRAQVRQLGGTIELSSRPGEGTEITIRLPLNHDMN